MGHARTLIGLSGAQQVMLAEEIIQSNLSEGDGIEIDFDADKKEITVKTVKPKGKKKKEDN